MEGETELVSWEKRIFIDGAMEWVFGSVGHRAHAVCLFCQGIIHFPGGNAYSVFAYLNLSTITERAV